MCERAKKNKRNFFFNRMTYIRIVVINLIIMNLFRVCPVIFPLKKKKGFPRKYLCFVCDFYFRLLIL